MSPRAPWGASPQGAADMLLAGLEPRSGSAAAGRSLWEPLPSVCQPGGDSRPGTTAHAACSVATCRQGDMATAGCPDTLAQVPRGGYGGGRQQFHLLTKPPFVINGVISLTLKFERRKKARSQASLRTTEFQDSTFNSWKTR